MSRIVRAALDAIPNLLALAIFVFLVAPILVVVVMSFSAGDFLQFPPDGVSLRWYSNFFSSIEWRDATRVSLTAGLLTVAVAVPVGFLAAYSLTQYNGKARSAIMGWLLVPIIVPTVLLAVGVYYIFAKLGLVNTITGLVLAHSALALPFVVVTLLASLNQVDFQLERAAQSLGAAPWYAVLTVTLPLVRRGLIASALLAFLASLDDVIIALLITLGEKSTLSRRMFISIRDKYDPTIASISAIMIILSLGAVLLSVRGGAGRSR
jgi:putative spermidine/putrescine transport system permease protein